MTTKGSTDVLRMCSIIVNGQSTVNVVLRMCVVRDSSQSVNLVLTLHNQPSVTDPFPLSQV